MHKRAVSSLFAIALLIALGHCGGSTFTEGDVDASAGDGSSGDAPSDVAQPPPDGGGPDASVDANVRDAASCNPACPTGRTCCGTTCVNTDNDPQNCGGCGIVCMGTTPYCDGTCKAVPCAHTGGCQTGGSCCGTQCCDPGDICCKSEGPVGATPQCFTPTASQPSCPQGCAPACVSDRNAKRDVEPVDDRTVLESLARVPMSTWSYKADDPSVRHIGPMAQDFHAAFGTGDTDLTYDPIDAHGVAFASIKALYAMVQEQNARIEKLEKENRELRARLR